MRSHADTFQENWFEKWRLSHFEVYGASVFWGFSLEIWIKYDHTATHVQGFHCEHWDMILEIGTEERHFFLLMQHAITTWM